MLNRSSILNITLIVPYIPDGLILVFQNKKLDHSLGTVLISHSTPPQKTQSDFQCTLTYIKQTISCYLSPRNENIHITALRSSHSIASYQFRLL